MDVDGAHFDVLYEKQSTEMLRNIIFVVLEHAAATRLAVLLV